MVAMSTTLGTFASRTGSSVSRLAAIKGREAFFEPLTGIAPWSGVPPRMRMRSMLGLADVERNCPPRDRRRGRRS